MSDQRLIAPSGPVVVAVDGSTTSYRAVAWGAAEAALHGCDLHLVTSEAFTITFVPMPFVTEDTMNQLDDAGEQILIEATQIAHDTVPGGQLTITTEMTFDPIVPTLIEISRSARMLVVGNRGRGLVGRALLGSVSSAVVQHASCPVAVVHTISGTDAATRGKPVVVGVDGSTNSVSAIELAFEEASLRKAELVALHSWSDATYAELAITGWDAARESADAVLAESLAGHADRYPDVHVRRIVVRDQPARSLLEEAENAQLVVVGTHGRGGFKGMLLGSTSAALVQSADCPVIVTR